MARNKVFRSFLAAVHRQVGSWKPKAEFSFRSSWPELIKKGAESVKRKNKGVTTYEYTWKGNHPNAVIFHGNEASHEIRLEDYGMMRYFKCGLGEDEEDQFDTAVFEESVRIAWNLREAEESEDVVRDLKRLIHLMLMNGKKKTPSELREIANCKQLLKKTLKELEKENDARVKKIFEENNRKKKKDKKARKGKVEDGGEAEDGEDDADGEDDEDDEDGVDDADGEDDDDDEDGVDDEDGEDDAVDGGDK